jgi:hypothetical protein
MNNSVKKVGWSIAVCGIAFSYLSLSTPGKLVVKDDGKIVGMLHVVREHIQGKAFWVDQLVEAKKDLAYELGEPERARKFDLEMRELSRESDAEMEKFHREYPDMRPTAAQVQAEALRKQADAIESEETRLFMEKLRLERVDELRRIKRVIEHRIKA